jgi:hypothetical protein
LDYVSRRQPKAKTDRRTRIFQLIVQIHRGDGVNATELKSVLGTSAWTTFRLQSAAAPARMPPQLAGELRSYLEAVRRADAKASRGGIQQRQQPRAQQFKLGYTAKRSAETEYEHALEQLEHIAESTTGLAVWFDRPLAFGQFGDLTPDAEGVPRLLGSRSPHAIKAVGNEEQKNAALACLYDVLKTCGPSKLTQQLNTRRLDTSCEVGADIDQEISATGSFDLDSDLLRGLL